MSADMPSPTRDLFATTRDRTGRTHTFRMTGIPRFCDDAMVERRALNRHFRKFGVWGELVSFEWGEPT